MKVFLLPLILLSWFLALLPSLHYKCSYEYAWAPLPFFPQVSPLPLLHQLASLFKWLSHLWFQACPRAIFTYLHFKVILPNHFLIFLLKEFFALNFLISMRSSPPFSKLKTSLSTLVVIPCSSIVCKVLVMFFLSSKPLLSLTIKLSLYFTWICSQVNSLIHSSPNYQINAPKQSSDHNFDNTFQICLAYITWRRSSIIRGLWKIFQTILERSFSL